VSDLQEVTVGRSRGACGSSATAAQRLQHI
jgi:hypothetical protein